LESDSINTPRRIKIHAVHEPIAGVILAAGKSIRFGRPKQLLDWHGKPLIWHVASKALRVGLNPVVVVSGAEYDQVRQALKDLPVYHVYNLKPEEGQGSSVSLGTQTVHAQCGGIVFLLADQPHVSRSLIRTLIDTHARTLNPVIGPMVDGKRGNPVLFDQIAFRDLIAISGDQGGRRIFSKYKPHWIPWYDPLVSFDIDTPDDYVRLLEIEA
jgi:molybdenum cofactor cytidylyltransferase